MVSPIPFFTEIAVLPSYSLLRWIKDLFQPTKRPARRSAVSARRVRLDLEQLESRVTPSTLGSTALLLGPAAGSDADIVASNSAWTATSNAAWLHTSSSGTGDGAAGFTVDANSGAARTGTLTIAGETLTITQAGAAMLPQIR